MAFMPWTRGTHLGRMRLGHRGFARGAGIVGDSGRRVLGVAGVAGASVERRGAERGRHGRWRDVGRKGITRKGKRYRGRGG